MNMVEAKKHRSSSLFFARLNPDNLISLAVPAWLPEQITSQIYAACFACQKFLNIHYGSAECTVCPLANFVKRLEKV